MHQGPAGAGADLALVQGEHGEAFQRLVQEGVVVIHHVLEEDVRRLAAQLQRHRNDVLGRVFHDLLTNGGRAGEGDLGDARIGGQRLADLDARARHDVQHAGRQQVLDQFDDQQNGGRGLFGRLQHDAVARRQGRSDLPRRHQDREVPGNDLPHHAQRLMEMIGDRVVVQLRNAAFLRADAAGEIAEVVDSQRYVGRQRLAHRLAIVPGLGLGDGLQVLFDPVGDAVQQQGAFRHAGLAPGVLGGVGGVQRLFDIGRVRTGHFAQDAAIHRGGVFEIAAVDRRDPLSADEVVIARLELGGGRRG